MSIGSKSFYSLKHFYFPHFHRLLGSVAYQTQLIMPVTQRKRKDTRIISARSTSLIVTVCLSLGPGSFFVPEIQLLDCRASSATSPEKRNKTTTKVGTRNYPVTSEPVLLCKTIGLWKFGWQNRKTDKGYLLPLFHVQLNCSLAPSTIRPPTIWSRNCASGGNKFRVKNRSSRFFTLISHFQRYRKSLIDSRLCGHKGAETSSRAISEATLICENRFPFYSSVCRVG